MKLSITAVLVFLISYSMFYFIWLKRTDNSRTMAPKLGYWAMRGLAQPARLMLKYAGVEFEDIRYVAKENPAYDPKKHQDWFDVKFKLGLDFPNIPYYIDGNIKLSQSTAIYRYIARKYDLYGSNDEERALVDMISEELGDIKLAVYDIVYYASSKEDYEEKLKAYEAEKLPLKLKQFNEFLGDNKWLVGDKITYADFHLYDVLDYHIRMYPECLKDFPKLKAYHTRFEKLPAIKAYMESDEFIKSPINDYSAYFVG